jgi:NADH-quinone oxidoreductase subunit H
MTPFWFDVLVVILKALVIAFGFAFGMAAVLSWVERKQSALIQDRYGPNRASILGLRLGGLFHMLADGIKIFTKEPFIPERSNRWLFWSAPIVILAPTLLVWVVIPFGPGETLRISSLGTGLLVIFAISGFGILGAVFAGWSSNNKFALLGGLRSGAQMVSYEVALGLSTVGVLMVYGSLDLGVIVERQTGTFLGFLPNWGLFTQPLAFIIFLVAALAENKRAPFDVVEADSELVAGYFTEYAGFAFAGIYFAEFVQMVVVAALLTTLFLGGWQIPYVAASTEPWMLLLHLGAFVSKVVAMIWFMMLIRWTLPRFRYDQVMDIGWKGLLPAGLANILITGVVLYATRSPWAL